MSAAASATKPTRIEPKLVGGMVVDQDPPCGGSWMRDHDGGLTPLDKYAAEGAGLAWGAEAAQQAIDAADMSGAAPADAAAAA